MVTEQGFEFLNGAYQRALMALPKPICSPAAPATTKGDFRPCLWPPSGKTARPWYASRTTSNRYGEVIDWSWLTDARGKTRKFASKEACQAACDEANGVVRA